MIYNHKNGVRVSSVKLRLVVVSMENVINKLLVVNTGVSNLALANLAEKGDKKLN